MKFKYVEFSRKTAKKNPSMIRHEYERLINASKEFLENFERNLYVVPIDRKWNKNHFTSNIIKNDHDQTITVKVNYNSLKEMVDFIEHKNSSLIEKKKILKELIEEYESFKRIYWQ